MKKAFRIKKNSEFQAVFQGGQSFANRQFVVYVLKKADTDTVPFRIGLSVSKKIGNAVKRNQIKRYIRQVFTELKEGIEQCNDYIIIARKPSAEMDFHEVKKSLLHVLKKANVLDVKSMSKKENRKNRTV
ncbi:ribonuclease P protein component [Oikeobacillus pervagus]|uniref:Ribonuclease P protein component n=1 Tax=Oikeobacillus pervagus TaxID=1325931 RepID=A0AAJ1T0W4_9BACI|nr:ribonuclease P protein component [Oikeobacillus pervagus]MDQ0216610.1 ribonuclease P protein component [Oikeobacillus pervagus]